MSRKADLRPYNPAQDRKPYERQPRESEQCWEAFLVYRDWDPEAEGGVRTKTGVARKLGKNAKGIQQQSRRWWWNQRVEAWDRVRDEAARKAELAAIAKMRKDHIKVAMATWGLGAQEVAKMIKASKDAGDVPTLKTLEALRLIIEGTNMERLGRGEPTDHTEVSGNVTWADMKKAAQK